MSILGEVEDGTPSYYQEGNPSEVLSCQQGGCGYSTTRFLRCLHVSLWRVVYLRIRYAETTISISLVAAKTWVAPLKCQTIPKLELCAALLTARLLATMAEDLSLDASKAYAWTDSSISWNGLTAPHQD